MTARTEISIMGIFAHRLYFKNGFPKVRLVQEKFLEITGLELSFIVDVHLNEITTKKSEIASSMSQSVKERDRIFSPDFQGDQMEAQKDLTSIGRPYFYCFPFDEILLDEYPEETSFYLECNLSTNSMYFFEALIKTMLELGGRTYTYNSSSNDPGHVIEDHLEEYNPDNEHWTSIKKWEETSDIERAKFQNELK
ncbi:hypothetical protein [Reichenbachiella versicolor]|uniref:hypothetical protein n=1 Tax=Reichenbachiella versicolor TaxID=1821036 RepID=UPI0013A52EA4|nr:hypothetical protein [Reichenbachiella versicolor]